MKIVPLNVWSIANPGPAESEVLAAGDRNRYADLLLQPGQIWVHTVIFGHCQIVVFAIFSKRARRSSAG